MAGLALIDSATPYQFDLPAYPGFYAMFRRTWALMPSLGRAGIGRLVAPAFGGLPPAARAAARAFDSSPRELQRDRMEFAELPRVFEQAKALRNLNGRPLAVLTADRGQQNGWAEAQDELARGATHAALLEDPRFAAITTRIIRDVVLAVRTGRLVDGRATRG